MQQRDRDDGYDMKQRYDRKGHPAFSDAHYQRVREEAEVARGVRVRAEDRRKNRETAVQSWRELGSPAEVEYVLCLHRRSERFRVRRQERPRAVILNGHAAAIGAIHASLGELASERNRVIAQVADSGERFRLLGSLRGHKKRLADKLRS